MFETPQIPLSSLAHYAYCPRRSALIHLEQIWQDNIYTERGQRLHQKADEPSTELLEGIRVERALALYHDALSLSGRADVVEFLIDGTPFPVEYKSGKRKRAPNPEHAKLQQLCDDIQLCAQALCLEDMLNTVVPRGAIYHAGSKRRRNVEFSPALRVRTLEIIEAVRTQLETRVTPPPIQDHRCPNCSLLERCMPDQQTYAHSDPFALLEANP
jgi:CRISPR-associated exonuclease Cas4